MVKRLAISGRTFQLFKSGDFAVEDRHSGGGEEVVDDAELEAILSDNSCRQTQGELSESLGWRSHDNAKPHIAKLVVKKYLKTLKWQILPHPPPYSPDVAPSHFHLTHLVRWHSLADQHFSSYEEVKNWIDS
nr:Mariner Mos1 transposase [Hymenolepis microstoma]